jgi:hypothetical protein
MAHYLFNFSKKGAAKGKTLREQAAELLHLKMWGIGSKTPNRLALAPGDLDRYLEALGYTELGDVQRGSPVESGNFPDYVLRVHGKAAIAIEAKKLGASLGPKDAAQVVAYCSDLGVRWGAVTDGRYLKLYDAPVLGIPPDRPCSFGQSGGLQGSRRLRGANLSGPRIAREAGT